MNCVRNRGRRAKSKKKRGLGANAAPEVAETRSEFSFAIAETAVAQICQSVGYKRTTSNALETLTNVATKYLQAIATSAASFANASNRTDANLFDLVDGIHELCSVQGIPSGSKVHHETYSGPMKEIMNFVRLYNEAPSAAKQVPCLLRSGALKEIMNFVKRSNEVPFAKPIPRKNVSGSPILEPTIDSSTKSQCLHHIPRWLPNLPEEATYKNRHKFFDERKCGEVLWEQSLPAKDSSGGNVEDENRIVSGSRGISNGKDEKDDVRTELAARGRERVKFKIGGVEEKKKKKQIGLGVKNMMNGGVFKGRKRVFWNLDRINDCMVGVNEDEKAREKR